MAIEKMVTARMKAQKRLNAFVRVIAFMERTGNAIGRLVLIWATVVVGFSNQLGRHFWFLVAIVILESFRAFSRESKSDDQLLFKTTEGIKIKRVSLPVGSLYYLNAMIITSSWFGFILSFIPFSVGSFALLPLLVLLNKASEPGLPKLIEKISRPKSSCWFIPPVVILAATIARFSLDPTIISVILLWFGFNYLARLQLPAAHRCLTLVKIFRPLLIIGIIGLMWCKFQEVAIVTMVAPLVLGNFQIPLAVIRILFGLVLLFGGDFHNLEDTKNGTHLVQTLKALYIMLICQGTLYILACLFESFSYFFRASLAVHCGLVDKTGMESIGLYYEQAYEMSVQESLLDTKKMSLLTFAVDSVNADVTRDKKLAAVKILNSFLQQDEEASNREAVSQVTASTKAVTTLISMLGWTVPEDANVRLFAAKVVADLARYMRIVRIPGTMQMVCSLLDVENKLAREDNSDRRVEGNGGTGDQEIRNTSSSPRVDGNGGIAGNRDIEIQDTRRSPSSQITDLERGNAENQPPMQDSSAQASGVREGSSRIHKLFLFFQKGGIWICKCRQHMKDIWSIPRDSVEDEDSIQVLGVLILEKLAHDVDNCAEISRSTEILPKIIGFISHITDTTSAQQKQIITSSLRLIAKLASVKGKIGVKLRKNISKNPLLLSKLAESSEDHGGPEQWKPMMDIIAKLAMDEGERQDIGGNQVIISKLMRTFVGRDETPNTCNDSLLRKAAGEALAMLAVDNASNCSSMLNEPGYELTKNLMAMLPVQDPDGEYVYLAAFLLQSVFTHSGDKLRHQDRNQDISSTLHVVLERIMKPNSEGKQLEALIGLASQIIKLLLGSITHTQITLPDEGAIAQIPLPAGDGAQALAKKLVDELNANKRPNTEIPNMRRRLVELAISMVKSHPIYAEAFRNHGMPEALSMVAKTPSKVERYRLFSGSIGLFPWREGDLRLSDLVTEAKELIIEPAAQATQ